MTEQKILEHIRNIYATRDYPALSGELEEWRRSRPFAGAKLLDATPVFTNTLVKYLPLLAGGAEIPLSGAALNDGVESVEYRDDDEKTRAVWSFVKPCRLLSFPMSTPGPDGGPQHFQCLKLFAVWDLELMGQGKLGLSSSLKVKKSGLFG